MDGHLIALIGGRAFCAGCSSVGYIAKAGGPYRPGFCGAEQVLEGDVVVCNCSAPPLLVSSRQNRATCDDRCGVVDRFSIETIGADWYYPNPQALTNSKKIVDAVVTHVPETDGTKTICPGMPDIEFFKEMMEIRDRAIFLINWKLGHLAKWNQTAQEDVYKWFGRSDTDTREYLRTGLAKTISVLKGLTSANFVRYSDDFAGRTACIPSTDPSVVAGVCKSDIKNKIIGIAHGFCVLEKEAADPSTKVGTLIHEVTHFDDVFSSDDHVYTHTWSRIKSQTDNVMPRTNADSISGYVMWGIYYGM